VACLRPPIPPPQTNLMITGWFGDPVPFGGIATYVCARGMQFENDPDQENVTYTCQVQINSGGHKGPPNFGLFLEFQ
jgi:hypothetical protein